MSSPSYRVSDAISALNEAFPLSSQDSWDNSGLLVGDASTPLRGVLFSLDLTESAVDQAIAADCNLVVSHHPLMFRGLKRLNGSSDEQRTIIKALKNGIALAAFHTPADKGMEGSSGSIGRLLGLTDMKILVPDADALCKIVVYVPDSHADAVSDAMSGAGAGHIGNYSHCAWRVNGTGQFMAEDGANPFVGSLGELHREPEVRIEAIALRKNAGRVTSAIVKAHPYEEPAIDIIPINNVCPTQGYGVVGHFTSPLSQSDFLALVKQKLECQCIRFAGESQTVETVAICTGSGSEFTRDAVAAGADAYITADVKYHQMADAAQDILVLDVGHFESEKITKCIFQSILTRKLHNFARYELSREANPVKYY